MSTAPGPTGTPTRARAWAAGACVALTVIGVWKLIDYRTQPPPPPAITLPG